MKQTIYIRQDLQYKYLYKKNKTLYTYIKCTNIVNSFICEQITIN